MKKLLTTFLFFVLIINCYSQEERFSISGIITHFETPIQDVHIMNITSNRGTISDEKGRFEIEVKLGDILFISHLEFKTKKINIQQRDIETENIKIYIEQYTNYLETVEIKNHNLTGSLLQDSKNISQDSIKNLYDMQMDFMSLASMPSMNSSIYQVDYEKPPMNNVDPTGSGVTMSSFGIPIRDKENELRRELRFKKSIPDKIIRDFGRDYFIKELKIPEDEIHLFITYCENQDIFNLYEKDEIIKIIEIFNRDSKIFNKRNK